MSVFIIPTRTDVARYRIGVELDEISYFFDFEWNDRDSAWYLSLYDVDENVLSAGMKCVINSNFWNNLQGADLPTGKLVLLDSSNSETDPGFADLGDRCKLYYVTADEFQ